MHQYETVEIGKCDLMVNGLTQLMGFQFPLKRLYMSMSIINIGMPRDADF